MSFYLKKRTLVISILVVALFGLGWLTSIDFWTGLKEVTTIPKDWTWESMKSAGFTGDQINPAKEGTIEDLPAQEQGQSEEKQSSKEQTNDSKGSSSKKSTKSSASKAKVNNPQRIINEVEEMMAAPVKKGEEGRFFSEYRMDRDRVRDRQIELLKEVANNHSSPAETRQEAEKKLLSITNSLSRELEIENLIKANNYQDAVIFLDRTSATVIIKAKSLSTEDVEKITKLVARHAAMEGEKITIIPKQ